MTCNCNEQPVSRRCACSRGDTPTPNKKAVVGFCDICNPCEENVSEARICAFVVPTLEEGRYFKNSFVFVEDEDSVYFITNERSEIPFGSRPKFIDNFDPEDPTIHFKNTVVYDIQGGVGHIYGPDGSRRTIALTDSPVTDIQSGENIIVTKEGGVYTVSADMTQIASAEGLQTVTLLAAEHTSQISELQTTTDGLQDSVDGLSEAVGEAQAAADAAADDAAEALSAAQVAQSTATEAAEAVAGKQDLLSAGDNITIDNNVISASVPSFQTATKSANGLMSSADRTVLNEQGVFVPDTTIETTSNSMSLDIDKYVSDTNGSSYTHTVDVLSIPMASTTKAGAMTAADKTKLDALDNVNDATITITQGGVFKGSFTTNQGSAATIALEGGSGGGATWGSIGGTLSNQVDLATALADKQATLTAGSGITIANNVISATGGGTSYQTITESVSSTASATGIVNNTSSGTAGVGSVSSSDGNTAKLGTRSADDTKVTDIFATDGSFGLMTVNGTDRATLSYDEKTDVSDVYKSITTKVESESSSNKDIETTLAVGSVNDTSYFDAKTFAEGTSTTNYGAEITLTASDTTTTVAGEPIHSMAAVSAEAVVVNGAVVIPETWTFTLSNNTTVTKTIFTGVSMS